MRRGPILALVAALLFGASTPLSKLILHSIDPLLLAALLYLGSGVGLFAWRRVVNVLRTHDAEPPLRRADVPWLCGAVLAGGVIAPALLMLGLQRSSGSTASLFLNLEGVFTALIAWMAFHENVGRRVAAGMLLIFVGAGALSWGGRAALGWPVSLIVLACLGWAIDNNLTRRVSASDPTQIAMIKGFTGAAVNGAIAFAAGAHVPPIPVAATAMLLGLASYGVSLTLFVRALRLTGAARTGAYFATGPFAGAILSLVLLREHPTLQLAIAAMLMAAGVWLNLSERHAHAHTHEPVRHMHRHIHDEHHQHAHAPGDPPGEPHVHEHEHAAMTHSHPHYPDIHHRHGHGGD